MLPADQSAGRRWERNSCQPFVPALGPLFDADANPDWTLEVADYTDNIEAARICLEAGADPRKNILSQEARAARLAARLRTHPGDGGKHRDREHPEDNDKNAAWSGEMESFIRSFDRAQ